MTTGGKVILVLGFVSAFCAQTFYAKIDEILSPILQDAFNNMTGELSPDGKPDYSFYYKLTALAFVCYTYVIYTLVRGWWSIPCFIIFLTALNSLADELFFNPTCIQHNEYVGFMASVIIAIGFRNKWEKNS